MVDQKMSITDTGSSGRAILFTVIAGVIVCGPLLLTMGLVLLATTTLLLIATPPLLLFSPVIIPAVLAIATALAGFGGAAVMAISGLWALRCACSMVVVEGRPVFHHAVESATETGQVVKNRALDIGNHEGQVPYEVEVRHANDDEE